MALNFFVNLRLDKKVTVQGGSIYYAYLCYDECPKQSEVTKCRHAELNWVQVRKPVVYANTD